MDGYKHIGFSGSREGMTASQRSGFLRLVQNMVVLGQPVNFHHGDCVGSDKEAHFILRGELQSCSFLYGITIHPPIANSHRAWCERDTVSNITVLRPDHYLNRDRFIVKCTDILIATPKTDRPYKGSGTWYTINYARNQGKHVIVLNP